jgi:hypothetical protein
MFRPCIGELAQQNGGFGRLTQSVGHLMGSEQADARAFGGAWPMTQKATAELQ